MIITVESRGSHVSALFQYTIELAFVLRMLKMVMKTANDIPVISKHYLLIILQKVFHMQKNK